ncbi:SCO family protein [Erythrobacter sp. Alg231-14]|uniref:SCO family protein n=1 Tax=Erythrobacter sp. Alg231-14 TaxID=1922225 RepID=UPI000D553469
MNIRAIPKPFLTLFALPAAMLASGCGTGNDYPVEPPLEGATIGGEFELSNSAGEPVRWADFDGQYRIVYFGFAYCPDICPTDMQRMAQGLNTFAESEPELAAKIQPIFITIDPERDTGEVLEQFTSAFSDRIIGLRGTKEQTEAAAKTFAVAYSRGEDTPGGGYLMNHSTIVYLFDPEGKPLATLPTDQGADAVAAELDLWVR